MDDWLVKIVGDVDSLHVEIENHKYMLVGFYFIRSIDLFKHTNQSSPTFLTNIKNNG